MRILVLSDLHLEIWGKYAPDYNVSLSCPDVVILAGDIHSDAKAVHWAAEKFIDYPVLYVHGNHEAYGKNLEYVQRDILSFPRNLVPQR